MASTKMSSTKTSSTKTNRTKTNSAETGSPGIDHTLNEQTVRVFGIRHHGPGSARSLVRSLQAQAPEILLIEGPPEANDTLPLLAEPDIKPPVSLLIYSPDNLQQAAYYPFAVFSPEWQAIQYGIKHNVPVRFMDLPQTHQMAERAIQASHSETETETETEATLPAPKDIPRISLDPLVHLARAAGYTDSERWWEHMVEHRQDSTALFEAILEAMSALRAETAHTEPATLEQLKDNPRELRAACREAFMRKTIRKAKKDGFQKIAVVCGAWHGPALTEPFPSQKADNALLKGLPKVKVKATWIPWTYSRLSTQSGYGAGIHSPGWYDHLWKSSRASHSTTQTAVRWLTKVARLLRKQDLDASSASVIEAVRLAEALAALRDTAMPGLDELNEATKTVLCFGEAAPLELIWERLIVSDRLGKVPASTPLIPLQQDLQQLQKKLRLKPTAADRLVTLDLRKEMDLERSHLLHRLQLLGIPWGKPQRTSGKGTFKEAWVLRWNPELSIAIIEAGQWGNTVNDAATAYTQKRADECGDLPALTQLIEPAMLADLGGAIAHLMTCLQNKAALSTDTTHLMTALPPLATILRYRDVRKTDTEVVAHVVDGLVTRICIGLPGACASLDDDAAAKLLSMIENTHSAIKLLQQERYNQAWSAVLLQLANQTTLHGLIAGYSCRLLLDSGELPKADAATRLGLALSLANEPAQAAAWVEGFLQGSGLLLLHDATILQVLDEWVSRLSEDAFITLLPLLRRTFSTFSQTERRQMGERIRKGEQRKGAIANTFSTTSTHNTHFNTARANTALPTIAQLLGLSHSSSPPATP
ncbi:MAG: DUF5682 family protein [Phormidesmis sp.]